MRSTPALTSEHMNPIGRGGLVLRIVGRLDTWTRGIIKPITHIRSTSIENTTSTLIFRAFA